jgi:hypothetical protein
VKTDHGEQAIETLRVGERVLAYHPQTGKREYEPILHVWINHDHDLVDLTMTTTTKGLHGKPTTKTSEVIHTNQKHPFLTMEDGFVPVGKLKLGMHLVRADGQAGVVTGWRMMPGASVMYNLEIEQDHTYAVGDGQWVVHNSGCYDLAEQAQTTLETMRGAGENVRAVTTSNVLHADGNPITNVTNSSPGATSIGTTPAQTELWGGWCAETQIASQIANALSPGNGGSIEGENIQIGLAHQYGIGPCPDCVANVQALANQFGEVNVSFFSFSVTQGSGYDIWTFTPVE